MSSYPLNSVVDPWRFGTDPDADPEPRIRTSLLRIRRRIREAQKHTGTDPGPEHWTKKS